MVEGTGLENQRWKHPQVRILSFPPLAKWQNYVVIVRISWLIESRFTRCEPYPLSYGLTFLLKMCIIYKYA